jgi:ApeA N-terminal domain 1
VSASEKRDQVTEPENSESLTGRFWQLETPNGTVPGELTIDESGRSRLEVVGRIFVERAYPIDSRPGHTRMGSSGDPEDLVADWQPRDILGELDDGTPVSLLEARGGRVPDFFPVPYRQEFQWRAW